MHTLVFVGYLGNPWDLMHDSATKVNRHNDLHNACNLRSEITRLVHPIGGKNIGTEHGSLAVEIPISTANYQEVLHYFYQFGNRNYYVVKLDSWSCIFGVQEMKRL